MAVLIVTCEAERDKIRAFLSARKSVINTLTVSLGVPHNYCLKLTINILLNLFLGVES